MVDLTPLSAMRADIARLRREAAAIASAPLDHAGIRRAVAQFLDDKMARARLDAFDELTSPVDHGGIISFDVERLLLNLFRDEIEKRLTDYLVAVTPEPGLPATKRAKEIAKLQAQQRALEREEELLILAAEDAGEKPARRNDVDGQLLAEVWAEALGDDGRLRAA